MVSRVIPVKPFDLVIFGGTGDLARRKVLPGLFRRFCAKQMPKGAQIIGAARSNLDTGEYRGLVAVAIQERANLSVADGVQLEAFLQHIWFVSVDALGTRGWEALKMTLREETVRAFYFSVAPALFGQLAQRLRENGLVGPASRVVVEKPFGRDLQSARALNADLAAHFDEDQVYRIDHYLGKETVQNLMVVRFGNMLFEPLWNSQYIDHVQITVAERIGVGGRGSYYDKSGAMRDMVQNHLMQLLCLIAMEPPAKFDPDAVRDEKLKVIRALDPVPPKDLVLGQYRASDTQAGFLEDVGSANSNTESFVALKAHISNWRWAGTPFYLRTGKCLRARSSEIAIMFKDTPHSIFPDTGRTHRNVLAIQLQPNEGMTLDVTIKEPGPGGMRLLDVPLDMSFADALETAEADIPDAYERLIMDVIRGNQTLFMRGDEVEAAWAWTDSVILNSEALGAVPQAYDIGSSGPDDAMMLLHRDARRWREIR